jgi:hypothetical protein
MLESICDERRDLSRGRGVQHVSEIVPFVLAKIVAVNTQAATERHPRAQSSLSHNMMPTPGVLAEV